MSEAALHQVEFNETEHLNTSLRLAREQYDVAQLESLARVLIESRERTEHDDWEHEPDINARTALFEALTAKGHLSEIVFDEDVDTINEATLRRLLNGWSDTLPDWEKERRFREIVEELTVHQLWESIKSGELPEDMFVLTISDYPEKANPKTAHLIGYRELNKKGFVRGHFFECGEDGVWRRVTEQVSRSNSNNGSSAAFLTPLGVDLDDYPDSTAVLSTQVLTSRRAFLDGVVGVQRELDALSGAFVRYGEDIRKPGHNLPEYGELRRVSREREAQVEFYIKRFADFERNLNVKYKAGLISYDEKLRALRYERKEIIDEICLLDPSYARDARGEESAKHFEKAALAMASGDDASGVMHYEKALSSADSRADPVCGGNSTLDQAQQLSNKEAAVKYHSAKESRKNWKWKRDTCIVEECPTRPKKVEVGPCNVCRSCQDLYDRKKDPAEEYKKKLNQIKRAGRAVVETFKEDYLVQKEPKMGDKEPPRLRIFV